MRKDPSFETLAMIAGVNVICDANGDYAYVDMTKPDPVAQWGFESREEAACMGLLRVRGLPVVSIEDALAYQAEGYRVFSFHEQDESRPEEITGDIERIGRDSVADSLLVLPPKIEPEQAQGLVMADSDALRGDDEDEDRGRGR